MGLVGGLGGKVRAGTGGCSVEVDRVGSKLEI